MKKLLLALMLLLSVSPANAQRSPWGFLEKTTFLVSQGEHYGTAFCAPGKSSMLLTAAHVIGADLSVTDYQGTKFEVQGVFKDDSKDIAAIILKDPAKPCEFSGLEFAKQNAAPGTDIWLNGYGGGMKKPILTKGIISSPTDTFEPLPQNQVAQLNALGGHSGGPVIDSTGHVVGMIVGGLEALDEIDVIVPVEVLRKFLK